MDENKKPSVKSAAAVSMAVVMFSMVMDKPKSDLAEIIAFFAVLGMAAYGIAAWVKYLKNYVDFAIEQKLRSNQKEAKG